MKVPCSLYLSKDIAPSALCYIIAVTTLFDFVVGLTNQNPESVYPLPGTYSICATFNGESAVKTDTVEVLHCTEDHHVYHYVIIQIPDKGGYLKLCEVVVNVGEKGAIICYTVLFTF